MTAYILVVLSITLLAGALALRDWLKENKAAILEEAEHQRRIKQAVNQGWKEREARILKPLNDALAHANAALARVELRRATVVDGVVVVVEEDK